MARRRRSAGEQRRDQPALDALLGDGAVRGESDDDIDNGMDPGEVARRILEALGEGRRELVVARAPS